MLKKTSIYVLLSAIITPNVSFAGMWGWTKIFYDPCNAFAKGTTERWGPSSGYKPQVLTDMPDIGLTDGIAPSGPTMMFSDTYDKLNSNCPPYNRIHGRTGCLYQFHPQTTVAKSVSWSPPMTGERDYGSSYRVYCAEYDPASSFQDPKVKIRMQSCSNLLCSVQSDTLHMAPAECKTMATQYILPTIRFCARLARDDLSGTSPGYHYHFLDSYGFPSVYDNGLASSISVTDATSGTTTTTEFISHIPKICVYEDPSVLQSILLAVFKIFWLFDNKGEDYRYGYNGSSKIDASDLNLNHQGYHSTDPSGYNKIVENKFFFSGNNLITPGTKDTVELMDPVTIKKTRVTYTVTGSIDGSDERLGKYYKPSILALNDDSGFYDMNMARYGGTTALGSTQGGTIPTSSNWKSWVYQDITSRRGSLGCTYLKLAPSPPPFCRSPNMSPYQVQIDAVCGQYIAFDEVDFQLLYSGTADAATSNTISLKLMESSTGTALACGSTVPTTHNIYIKAGKTGTYQKVVSSSNTSSSQMTIGISSATYTAIQNALSACTSLSLSAGQKEEILDYAYYLGLAVVNDYGGYSLEGSNSNAYMLDYQTSTFASPCVFSVDSNGKYVRNNYNYNTVRLSTPLPVNACSPTAYSAAICGGGYTSCLNYFKNNPNSTYNGCVLFFKNGKPGCDGNGNVTASCVHNASDLIAVPNGKGGMIDQYSDRIQACPTSGIASGLCYYAKGSEQLDTKPDVSIVYGVYTTSSLTSSPVNTLGYPSDVKNICAFSSSGAMVSINEALPCTTVVGVDPADPVYVSLSLSGIYQQPTYSSDGTVNLSAQIQKQENISTLGAVAQDLGVTSSEYGFKGHVYLGYESTSVNGVTIPENSICLLDVDKTGILGCVTRAAQPITTVAAGTCSTKNSLDYMSCMLNGQNMLGSDFCSNSKCPACTQIDTTNPCIKVSLGFGTLNTSSTGSTSTNDTAYTVLTGDFINAFSYLDKKTYLVGSALNFNFLDDTYDIPQYNRPNNILAGNSAIRWGQYINGARPYILNTAAASDSANPAYVSSTDPYPVYLKGIEHQTKYLFGAKKVCADIVVPLSCGAINDIGEADYSNCVLTRNIGSEHIDCQDWQSDAYGYPGSPTCTSSGACPLCPAYVGDPRKASGSSTSTNPYGYTCTANSSVPHKNNSKLAVVKTFTCSTTNTNAPTSNLKCYYPLLSNLDGEICTASVDPKDREHPRYFGSAHIDCNTWNKTQYQYPKCPNTRSYKPFMPFHLPERFIYTDSNESKTYTKDTMQPITTRDDYNNDISLTIYKVTSNKTTTSSYCYFNLGHALTTYAKSATAFSSPCPDVLENFPTSYMYTYKVNNVTTTITYKFDPTRSMYDSNNKLRIAIPVYYTGTTGNEKYCSVDIGETVCPNVQRYAAKSADASSGWSTNKPSQGSKVYVDSNATFTDVSSAALWPNYTSGSFVSYPECTTVTNYERCQSVDTISANDDLSTIVATVYRCAVSSTSDTQAYCYALDTRLMDANSSSVNSTNEIGVLKVYTTTTAGAVYPANSNSTPTVTATSSIDNSNILTDSVPSIRSITTSDGYTSYVNCTTWTNLMINTSTPMHPCETFPSNYAAPTGCTLVATILDSVRYYTRYVSGASGNTAKYSYNIADIYSCNGQKCYVPYNPAPINGIQISTYKQSRITDTNLNNLPADICWGAYKQTIAAYAGEITAPPGEYYDSTAPIYDSYCYSTSASSTYDSAKCATRDKTVFEGGGCLDVTSSSTCSGAGAEGSKNTSTNDTTAPFYTTPVGSIAYQGCYPYISSTSTPTYASYIKNYCLASGNMTYGAPSSTTGSDVLSSVSFARSNRGSSTSSISSTSGSASYTSNGKNITSINDIKSNWYGAKMVATYTYDDNTTSTSTLAVATGWWNGLNGLSGYSLTPTTQITNNVTSTSLLYDPSCRKVCKTGIYSTSDIEGYDAVEYPNLATSMDKITWGGAIKVDGTIDTTVPGIDCSTKSCQDKQGCKSNYNSASGWCGKKDYNIMYGKCNGTLSSALGSPKYFTATCLYGKLRNIYPADGKCQ